MKVLRCCAATLLAVLAGGCGGGDHSAGNIGTGKAYNFVLPKVNSQQIYAVTTLDNSNNSINQTTRNTVTAVNADGSYSFVHDDPTGSSITVNGTTYSTPTESITANSSGQELSYTLMPTNGNGVTCTVTPHGAGPTYPVTVGQTWTSNYSVACGTAAPVPYTQTGSVVAVEPVTVPAGTFSAVKLQSTVVGTDPTGTIRTQTVTTWRDVSTEIIVKRVTNAQYGGTALVNGYPVTTTTVLESQL